MPRASLIIVNEGEYEAYREALNGFDGLLAITLGSRGAKLLKGSEDMAEAKPPKVEVVDMTGAGDSFAAGSLLL